MTDAVSRTAEKLPDRTCTKCTYHPSLCDTAPKVRKPGWNGDGVTRQVTPSRSESEGDALGSLARHDFGDRAPPMLQHGDDLVPEQNA